VNCAQWVSVGVLVYCSDYHGSHSVTMSADRWADHFRSSDLEPLFVSQACGTRPADLRPDFNWQQEQSFALALRVDEFGQAFLSEVSGTAQLGR